MKNKASLTTSWDDGHPLDLRIADLLDRHGLTGTFYIPRNASSGTMSVDQVGELAERFEIGSHTMDHTFLDTVDEATARAQIFDSKKWVEDITGTTCPMFCPPGGKFEDRDIGLIREAGYRALRSVELMSIDHPRDLGDGLSLLPTTIHAYPQPPHAYVKNAIKRRNASNLWRYIVNGHTLKWTILAESMLQLVQDNGGVFHLWGHSWELEETKQWERLEEVFKLMAAFSRYVPVVTNGALVSETPSSIAA